MAERRGGNGRRLNDPVNDESDRSCGNRQFSVVSCELQIWNLPAQLEGRGQMDGVEAAEGGGKWVCRALQDAA